jgi:hypothetical protein
MASRKRTEITIETHEVLIVRRGDASVRAWCSGCNAEVRMIGIDEAVALSGISIGAIAELVAARAVHGLRDSAGAPIICLKSLVDILTSKSVPPA